jgi:glycosyltransferase involved in cell wall biosynthesis
VLTSEIRPLRPRALLSRWRRRRDPMLARRQRGSPRLRTGQSGPPPSLSASSADIRPESPAPTRAIRVLIVAARFLPDLGGTETHIHEVTRRIAKRKDLDLTVLTTDRSGVLPAREESDGFTILRHRSYPQRRDYYFSPGVYREVLSGNYDLVHCQGIHTAVPVLAMMAAKRKQLPYIVTLHTGGHSSSLRSRLRSIQWRALGSLLRGAVVIVAVSRFEKQMFEKTCSLGGARLRIIQNGGELPASVIRPEMIPGRIVSCGRLERYKGHQRVIEALPLLHQTVPDATLHILGSGPYEKELRSLINALGLESTVTIEHIVPGDRQRMAESLGRAAVVTVLSEYEAHPVAVAEALALGIPAVGLDATGISDLIQDGLVWGVPKDASPAMIAGALVSVLRSNRTNSPARLPTWDAAAIELAHIYMDAVGPAPGSVHR